MRLYWEGSNNSKAGIGARPLDVIPNAVALQPPAQGGTDFVFAGRLAPEKGLPVLLEAAEEADAPLIIVGGQIARDLGINSGVDVFGAGYRANATIGRTIRLVLMNLCGAKPGMLDKATLGHPGKYSYCIAENEEASPWEPLRVSKGFPEEVSTVTVVASEAPHYVTNHGSYTPQALLDNLADAMSSLGSFANADWVVVVCPEHAAVLARHRWSRSDVQSYLVENCRRSVADLKRVDRRPGPVQPGDEHEMVLMLSDPEDITLVVAGGGAGGFSAVIPPWAGGKSSRMVTRAIGVCVDC